MRICFASHNENKVKEMNAIMPDSVQIIGLKDVGITEDIEETGSTLEENSRIKAEYVFQKVSMPVFADDSGLIVRSLNGDPGVFSARYAGSQKNDEDNMDLLLKNLVDVNDRYAAFQTIITFIDNDGTVKQFKGEIDGAITNEKKGVNGFGYDPIFQPQGYNKTFAELSDQEKNNISHRSRAIQKLLKHIGNVNG